jgi:hypothetical protein
MRKAVELMGIIRDKAGRYTLVLAGQDTRSEAFDASSAQLSQRRTTPRPRLRGQSTSTGPR